MLSCIFERAVFSTQKSYIDLKISGPSSSSASKKSIVRALQKQLKNKIIGVTCHNSKSLAKIAVQNKADYLAFGSFNKSKLKPNAKKANLNILKWAKRNIKKPIINPPVGPNKYNNPPANPI